MGRTRPASARSSQHFLRSRRLAAELVRDACVERGDLVLDIGAGTGLITAELVRAGARVVALELDPALAHGLRARFAEAIDVVAGDAVAFALPAEPFSVVANLPFHRANAILRRLLDDPSVPLEGAELIVEWGVALKRAAVWPSTLLGAYWGAWHTFSVGRRLPRLCFSPPPAVDAGVLRVARRAEPLVPIGAAGQYRVFVAGGFAAADLPLQRSLEGFATTRQLRRLLAASGSPRGARARDLDAHQWSLLFQGAIGAVRPRR